MRSTTGLSYEITWEGRLWFKYCLDTAQFWKKHNSSGLHFLYEIDFVSGTSACMSGCILVFNTKQYFSIVYCTHTRLVLLLRCHFRWVLLTLRDWFHSSDLRPWLSFSFVNTVTVPQCRNKSISMTCWQCPGPSFPTTPPSAQSSISSKFLTQSPASQWQAGHTSIMFYVSPLLSTVSHGDWEHRGKLKLTK